MVFPVFSLFSVNGMVRFIIRPAGPCNAGGSQ